MTANRRNINELRYLTRNSLIVPYNDDIRRNRTVSNRNPKFSQSSASPLYKEILRFLPKLRKIEGRT